MLGPRLGALCLNGLAAACILGACGSATAQVDDATPPDSAAALVAVISAANTTMATTARFLEIVPASSFGIGSGNITGQGGVDFGSGAGSVVFSPQDHSYTMPAVFAPKSAYIKPPAQAHWGLPSGASWLMVDTSGSDTLTGNFSQVGTQLEALNPYFTTAEIAWGAVAAGEIGTTTLEGKQVTDYAVTVSLQQVESHSGGDAGKSVDAVIGQRIALNGGKGDVTFKLRVSVDSNGRIVSVRNSGSQPGPANLTLSGFGTAISSSPPAVADTVDAATLGPSPETEKTKGHDGDAS